MHEAGAIVAGASIAAARAVWEGRVGHAFNAAGGLHHAMPARACGFCVYDDPAVAIAWLLPNGAERVAYVDVDVHHGDGVQAIFWNEPRVLTISLHEYEHFLFFPGTGDLTERGGPDAPGSAINVPLPANTGDDAWLEALRNDRAARGRGLRSRRARDPAGVRHARHRSARAAPAHDASYREAARVLHDARARRGRRPLGRDRRRRLPVGARRAARVDARTSPRWRAADELPDALPESWIEVATARAGEPVPATFSEPPLDVHRADEDARGVVARLADILWA